VVRAENISCFEQQKSQEIINSGKLLDDNEEKLRLV